MKNWRELGEVPDSEDESVGDAEIPEGPPLDQSPEPVPEPVVDETGPGNVPTRPDDADIWSLPSSSPDRPAAKDSAIPRQTSPYGSESTPSAQSIRENGGGGEISAAAVAAGGSHTMPQGDLPKSREDPFWEDEIATSYVRTMMPDSPASTLVSLLSRTPTPPRSPLLSPARSRTSEERENPVGGDEVSRQAAVRLERSLRPRKPIQQHPYLLENAQYTTFMKSHGIKPIKVVPEPVEEDDSQEQDYQAEAEDSQNASAGSPNREAEVPVFFRLLDDGDELALSPSLPKTSSPHLMASSQRTSSDQTDVTSLSDDDDLPPLNRLLPVSAKKRRAVKHQTSPLMSSARRKRARFVPDSSSPPRPTFIPPPNIWDLSSSPHGPQEPDDAPQGLGAITASPTHERPLTPYASKQMLTSVSSSHGNGTAATPILIDEDSESRLSDADSATSHSLESDSDVVRYNSRRIRGVLPASWLRLDQKKNDKPPARNAKKKSPEPSPNRSNRRGVALPRQGSPKPSGTAPFLFEDSEESDSASIPRENVPEALARITTAAISIDDNDADSAMEDDAIDWMLPGRKRSGSHSGPRRAKKQKKTSTQSVFKGNPNQPSRQPKITQVLGRLERPGATSASVKKRPTDRQRRERNGPSEKRRPRNGVSTPPLLSILDVVEPDAPKYLKIAARAVRKKANLGKTSPSKKLISLATRSDNIDALSTLRDWKSGKTRPRIQVSLKRQQGREAGRPALREIPPNIAPNPTIARPRPSLSVPQKLTRQSSLDGFVTVDMAATSRSLEPPPIPKLPRRKPMQDHAPSFRPAQLEVVDRESRWRQLSGRKRTLDGFCRRFGLPRGSLLNGELDQPFLDTESPIRELKAHGQNAASDAEEAPPATAKKRESRSRFRKRRRPQHLDPEAPQYAHANDPLPVDLSIADVQPHHSEGKLRGLGPYGTHYSQHFDVFPLERGTFFHESTVIGRGSLRDAADTALSDRIRHQRPTSSFSFDGNSLRWGAWDDATSSELGILVDWVAEQLGSDAMAEGSTGRKVMEAADFVLGYILGSLSVRNDLEKQAFVSRCLEVFSSFIGRFESLQWVAVPVTDNRSRLDVAVRFILALLAVRSLSHPWSDDPMQAMKIEDMIKKFASIIVRRLLEIGTQELRTLYGDLQRPSFRERGIRSDQVVANCWVVVVAVLRSAAIRGGPWDITHSVMLSRLDASGSDVQTLEALWQDMFTLLPLCEIDNTGILVPGSRNRDPVEGWALPQQLLRRVFELYKSNPRQPPGFNDYCRALMARCHLLVQQWGWRKCTGIIGTIFDFFGSQNLAHLRNEEVYKSPRFLEELDSNPSLSIEPEDRCFHIFIKLLALAIQRLKQAGRQNDIKNLVARTLPNHNRQYLKEDTVHQHDLAALRNHHDLLCTLFWVSPPEMRPAVRLIEKLVIPGSAHKEACLINIRAWNQLARFVNSNGEDIAAFKPFAAWRNNIFNQVLDQYLSAASDIEQQFNALSSELHGITKEARDEMIAKNKATALDVLRFSMKASLDVLQRAPTLEAALGGLNTAQLQKTFTSLDHQAPDFDWSVVRVALDTLEHFLGRIDEASDEQYSSEFASRADSHHVEEAVLLLNEHLVKDFFQMSRTMLSLPLGRPLGQQARQVACTEKAVNLAARIAARFIKNRVTQLSPYFSSGKYGLFSDLPKNLQSPERKYLPLFVAVLVKNHVFDFRGIGVNILGLWILSIVKPQGLLGYENYLAEVLQHHHLPFLDRATVAVGIPPDYNSNTDMFACAIHYMRRTLRESGTAQARQHREDFCKILQLAMQKMQEDLVSLRPHAAEHGPYIEFVRQIISLIKSHGVGICVVNPFFTKPSIDYSPSLQDPELHTAGIVAYGVRLSEKDVTAVPQLFHYLYNNFKVALANGKLEQECRILGTAMENAHVTSFMLQSMLPAVVQASAQTPDCWALLEVYVVALGNMLGAACVPKELAGDDVKHAASVLSGLLAWFDALGRQAVLTLQQVHVMTLLATIANVLQPSLTAYLLNEPEGAVPGLEEVIDCLSGCFGETRSNLEEALLTRSDGDADGLSDEGSMQISNFLASGPQLGLAEMPAIGDTRVQDFAKTIVSDVRRNWVVSRDCVMVRVPGSAGNGGAGGGGTPTMTQPAAAASRPVSGTRYLPFRKEEILRRLCVELGKWTLHGMGGGGVVGWEGGEARRARGREKRRDVVDEDLLF
ncbi:hypothetical protein N656DRAFT_842476 [Canariomyces notabilis]|uniref:Uncharacterized protein n=1 Tax=Canariomyces notabilis TaxID=2074819 RepID=A0AAN6YVU6_9PEZI|nr:hypothetical protein N656DRAFT_842476 [Canariomyces arenarius]